LFIIYDKEFHRSLWSVPKVPLGWDSRNKIPSVPMGGFEGPIRVGPTEQNMKFFKLEKQI